MGFHHSSLQVAFEVPGDFGFRVWGYGTTDPLDEVQATLLDGRWFGRADVLMRVPRASRFGDWSYEVWDTKLARETKGGSVLQICLYSDLLGVLQGVCPEHMYIVPPRDDFKPDEFRVDDYLAYYRLVRRRLEQAVGGSAPASSGIGGAGGDAAQGSLPFLRIEPAEPVVATYPDPVAHCEICRWFPVCDARRRKDDHLSFVAGISRLQTRELQAREVKTLEALAALIVDRLKPENGVLFHAAGTVTAGDLKTRLEGLGYRVRRAQLYEARIATSLSTETRANLTLGGIDAVLLFSPRTAATFGDLWRAAGSPSLPMGTVPHGW